VSTLSSTDASRSSASDSNANWIIRARDIVADLQQHSPAIYWFDFLVSIGVAWTLTAVFLTASELGAMPLMAMFGACILFYRAGTFMHELVHFKPGEMLWFGRAWNLLLGLPLLMPWIFYRNHMDHHNVRVFGTPDDGEYLPLASSPLRETLRYLLQAPVLALFTVIRFGLVGPLSWLHTGLREWVLTAASAGVINPFYRKRFPAADEKHLLIMEILCFAWLVVLATLLAKGLLSWQLLARAYCLVAVTLALNWVRTLAAHGYGNRGERMSYSEQFADSINISGQTWLTIFLFPVGLRYHALHHLFPALPYHNLGKAHQRLTAQLPADCPYHLSSCNSFIAVVAKLWRGAQQTKPENSAVLQWRTRNSAT
jgi:fatty acid desaturase